MAPRDPDESQDPSDEPAAPSEGSASAPSAEATEAPERWWDDPWLRFTAIFAGLALTSEVAYYAFLLGSDLLEQYLAIIAAGSAKIIHLFDPEAVVSGSQIGSAFFIVDIAPECDAVQLSALLASAVVAFPVSWGQRLLGALVCLGWLQAVNFARIVSLYYIGGAHERYFDNAHEVVWPAILIVTTVLTWIAWARWIMPDELDPERFRDDAPEADAGS